MGGAGPKGLAIFRKDPLAFCGCPRKRARDAHIPVRALWWATAGELCSEPAVLVQDLQQVMGDPESLWCRHRESAHASAGVSFAVEPAFGALVATRGWSGQFALPILRTGASARSLKGRSRWCHRRRPARCPGPRQSIARCVGGSTGASGGCQPSRPPGTGGASPSSSRCTSCCTQCQSR